MLQKGTTAACYGELSVYTRPCLYKKSGKAKKKKKRINLDEALVCSMFWYVLTVWKWEKGRCAKFPTSGGILHHVCLSLFGICMVPASLWSAMYLHVLYILNADGEAKDAGTYFLYCSIAQSILQYRGGIDAFLHQVPMPVPLDVGILHTYPCMWVPWLMLHCEASQCRDCHFKALFPYFLCHSYIHCCF